MAVNTITTRYILKKISYITEQLVTWDRTCSYENAHQYNEQMKLLSDIQIVGIYKTKETAEAVKDSLKSTGDDLRIDEIAWEE